LTIGHGGNHVAASAVGLGSITFIATAVAGPAAVLTKLEGDLQFVTPGGFTLVAPAV
jgi:hypothetical protein